MNDKIDFIITWVDGSDENWKKEKNKYQIEAGEDVRESRYRDWDNLKYWFRSIEKNAPWVNNIYFVTYGHLPKWLNTNHHKLKIVKHTDYLPKEYIPTFCSRPIDMNFHRIKGLENNFVYFNDDMFLLKDTNDTDFFVNNQPCENAILNASGAGLSGSLIKNQNNATSVYLAPSYATSLINCYFKKNEAIKKSKGKWFSLKNGKYLIRTIMNMPYNSFHGFYTFHIPYSYNKKTYEMVWELEYKALNDTCEHKFRKNNDLNHLIFTYYQIASGNFAVRKTSFGKKFNIFDDDKKNQAIYDTIKEKKYKVICLNDNLYDNKNFEVIHNKINQCFDSIFPNKSEFEL